MGLFGNVVQHWVSQAKYARSNIGELSSQNLTAYYSDTHVTGIDSQEKGTRQHILAQQIQTIQSCFDRAEYEFQRFIINRAECIFGKPLPRSVMALLTRVYFHFAMRGVLDSGEWKDQHIIHTRETVSEMIYNPGKIILNLLVHTHPNIVSFRAVCSAMNRGTPLFSVAAELTDTACGTFWKKCIEAAGKSLVEIGCLYKDEIECFEAEDILKGLFRIKGFFHLQNEPENDPQLDSCRRAFQDLLYAYIQTVIPSIHTNKLPDPMSDDDDGKEYTYCTVRIAGIEKNYSYLTGDGEYVPGDIVDVPFGRENTRRSAEIIAVTRCTASDAPYPPGKTKTIFGKTNTIDD